MFYSPPPYDPPFDPLDRILNEASADHLTALAGYYEHQARLLRAAAYAQRRREGDTREHVLERSKAELAFLKMGARMAALRRIYGSAENACKILSEKFGERPDTLRTALRYWTARRKMLGNKAKLRG